jgi:deoxyribonuclease V
MEKEKRDEKQISLSELAQKYNIDLKKLEAEQEKLAKQLELKDSIDFSKIVKMGGVSNVFFKNKIISAIVVLEGDEIIEQKYFSDKVKFPYLPGFRAYRELPAMTNCFNQLDEKPEIIFIPGHGISHPRLGIASHFSLATGIPSVGVSESLLCGEVKDNEVYINNKVVAKIIQAKPGSRPLYVSPGNLISLKTASELAMKSIILPHKLPEPMHLAHRYAKQVLKEIYSKESTGD